MKNLAIILYSILLLTSCGESMEDHYRIVDIKIDVAKYEKDDNEASIDFSDSLFIGTKDTLVIRVYFIREYYSTKTSPSHFIRAYERGLEGSKENIKAFELNFAEGNDSPVIFGDTSFNCNQFVSFLKVDDFVEEFRHRKNSLSKFDWFGESMENVPLIFFTTGFENNESVQIKAVLNMDNSSSIEGFSNKLEIVN